MCAIPLKHAGHSVTIVERDGSERESHMAGIGMGVDVFRLLARHDRIGSPFSSRSTQVQLVNRDGSVKIMAYGRGGITSWDAFYYRLRSIFDGYVSSFYPKAPQSSDTDGRVSYESGQEVIQVARDDEDGSQMVLTVRHLDTQAISTTKADLVIGADGASSSIRTKYLPASDRRFVGYVTWRGTVPESKVSEATRETFKHSVSLHKTPGQRQHCVIYPMPGPDGTLEPGERWLNCAWYTNESPESLDDILTDRIDGHRHRVTVPAGRIRTEIWDARVKAARDEELLAAPFLEVVEKIERPFLQVITETDPPPNAAFEDGRLLLVGEALCQLRPHTGFSSAQAAFHSLCVDEYVRERMTLEEFNDKVTRFSRLHWWQSALYGKLYQESKISALIAACHFFWHAAMDKVRAWWTGQSPLLRVGAAAKAQESEVSAVAI